MSDDTPADSLFDAVEKADWITDREFYTAIVHFGDKDFATVCAIPGGQATETLKLVPKYMAKLVGNAENDGDMARNLGALLSEEGCEELWTHIDALLACTVIDWDLPELTDLMGHSYPGLQGLAPLERLVTIKRLPLPVLVRLLLAAVWLAKNW